MPTGLLERRNDLLFFNVAQCGRLRTAFCGGESAPHGHWHATLDMTGNLRRQLGDGNATIIRQEHRAFQTIAKLTYVAWPVVIAQLVHYLRWDFRCIRSRELLQNVIS